ncbi:MAG: short-chain dehydrogenase [Acidimicrobiaceae bacterium]|nr:short-chain dehydrogenase [Acidimicrobiaceae bacterium]|tara:strand:+ start:380 stop:1126 length:747 start_codon:yes stop_codon:yes gene_type:complete
MDRFKEKIVFLTGAATGIGEATAKRMASEGASLYLVDVAKNELGETAEACRQFGGEIVDRICDVAKEEDVSSSIAETISLFGKIDIVANIAGIQLWHHTSDHPVSDFERTLAVNLTGTFLVCREAIPHLLKTQGSIVNVSSTTALAGIPYSAAYAASKAGVLALTKSLAVEYAKKGLQVNCINPGGIKTAMTKMPPIEDIDMDLLLRQNPLSPFVEPGAVAGLIAYLASDEGRHINGEHVRIDGAALA